jgi:hypothetical protein
MEKIRIRDLGSGMNIPDHISESLSTVTIFWVNKTVLEFFERIWIKAAMNGKAGNDREDRNDRKVRNERKEKNDRKDWE